MKLIAESIEKHRQEQLQVLNDECLSNGSYEQWYRDLEPFRRYMQKRYICFHLGKRLYKNRYVETGEGDLLDHHTISYLAPLDYKNIGWGSRSLYAYEQIKGISDYFKKRGTRFIYAALPNKGVVYPSRICPDESFMAGKSINVPQWRKYLYQVMDAGVETIDVLPSFMKMRDQHQVFSKEHHISSVGAKIISDLIADYLRRTTEGIISVCQIEREERYYFLSDYREPVKSEELCSICLISKNRKGKIPYWNQDTKNSKIAIFGDCNLQSYSGVGGGIAANLAYNLQYTVYNAGRKLIFDYDDTMTGADLRMLAQNEIVIYVAFSSAPFVRSTTMSVRHPSLGYKWCHLDLENG